MSNPDLTGDLKSLPEALRALPQVAPERSAWPQLAAELAAQGMTKPASTARVPATARRHWRWAVPAALAAGVLLAAGAWPLLQRPSATAITATATDPAHAASMVTNAANSTNATNAQSTEPASAASRLALLQQHSQALEHWLHETERAAAPLSGQDLAAAAELEDMIGLVDGQLNAAPPESELPLWQRRVALLEDLTALRYSSYRLAETGVALR
jgi:hypothetical protein